MAQTYITILLYISLLDPWDLPAKLVLLLIVAAALLGFTVGFPDMMRGAAPYVAGATFPIAHLLAPETVSDKSFYELSAQVVPVLFLALAFETRAFAAQGNRAGREMRMVSALVVAALLLAGFESLRVLAIGVSAKGEANVVIAGLAAAGIALAIQAIPGPLPGVKMELNEQR